MRIDKYSFTETETHSEEVFTTLSELRTEMPYLSKQTIKDWVLSGGKEIFKKGKIRLYKRDAKTEN